MSPRELRSAILNRIDEAIADSEDKTLDSLNYGID
jgi:hypothetical protein